MPSRCVVPTCTTGRTIDTSKHSIFSIPTDPALLIAWEAAIPGNITLKLRDVVCDRHFKEQDIARVWVKHDLNGKIIAQHQYKHPRLDKRAIPSKFDVASSEESSKNEIAIRVPDEPREVFPMSPTRDVVSTQTTCIAGQYSSAVSNDDIEYMERDPVAPYMEATCSTFVSSTTSGTEKLSSTDSSKTFDVAMVEESMNDPIVTNVPSPDSPAFTNTGVSLMEVISEDNFETLGSHPNPATEFTSFLPQFWSVAEFPLDGRTLFSYAIKKIENGIPCPVMQKSVILNADDNTLTYYVYGRVVDIRDTKLQKTLSSKETLPAILGTFKNMNLCRGLGSTTVNTTPTNLLFRNHLDQWHSTDCSVICKRLRCECCKKLRYRTTRVARQLRSKSTLRRVHDVTNAVDQRKVKALRLQHKRDQRRKLLMTRKTTYLLHCLQEQQEKTANTKTSPFDDICGQFNVPSSQKLALEEIIAAAKHRDTRGRRYTEQWMMLCMLMNIRSPAYYNFLRVNQILPLPCTRSIRGYFSMINSKCGFDDKFAKLLEKHFTNKTPLQRHGVLLLDEINLRKSVAVCAKNLTYVGLTDLGEDGPQSTDINEQATHGLVIMFQPLADSYTQPIAVFASKNPIKGEELAKLLVKGISYVENCGAKIHGVIADGASTNMKMWQLLDIRCTLENAKTWFTHPLDNEKKVFVFSDIPHVIKNIRNRLFTRGKLRIKSTEDYVRWTFFEALYDLDKDHPGNLRVCPKICSRHVKLDNMSKMRVRLATQIFSNSVAQGLAFYLAHGCKQLEGCETTIGFCKRINDLFNALNRKSPNQGLTPQSEDFKVLQEALQWLNEWEIAALENDIRPEEFLTKETSRGLRISLRSTIDMCAYLMEHFEFQYLLTGKVNQDNLEKFFGTIRQAAGCNDHPNCPTFLQLYELLSVYCIIKPPKSGNCTIAEANAPPILITLADLKSLYGEKSQTSLRTQYCDNMKKKLDDVLVQDDWEADDFIEHQPDHDYALSPILDCIIYYVTGF